MAGLVFYLFMVVLIVLFASQNLEVVQVHMIAGQPMDVPLIVVIGISFFVGFVSAILGVIRKAMKSNAKRQSIIRKIP